VLWDACWCCYLHKWSHSKAWEVYLPTYQQRTHIEQHIT
jgi:hypothetical protein